MDTRPDVFRFVQDSQQKLVRPKQAGTGSAEPGKPHQKVSGIQLSYCKAFTVQLLIMELLGPLTARSLPPCSMNIDSCQIAKGEHVLKSWDDRAAGLIPHTDAKVLGSRRLTHHNSISPSPRSCSGAVFWQGAMLARKHVKPKKDCRFWPSRS